MKKSALIVLKLAVIGVCFWIILSRVHLHEVYDKLLLTSIPFVLAAFVTVLVEPIVLAVKWNLLLREKEINLPLFRLVRIVFSCNFLSVAVPTAVGADALRVLMLRSQKHSLTHSAGSLIADRVLGVLAIVIVSLTASAAIWTRLPEKRVLVSVGVVAAIIVAAILILLSRLPSRAVGFVRMHLVPRMGRFRRGTGPDDIPAGRWVTRAAEKLEDIHESFRSFRNAPVVLFKVLILNFVIQLLRVVQIYLLFRAVGHPVPFSQAVAFVPIIVLMTLLPISYLGLGVKEGSFLYFFGQVGVPAAVCLSVSFITYILIFSAMLPGAFFVGVDALNGRAPPAAGSDKE